MTRGRGIIRIFRQKLPFWHSLIVWGVKMLVLGPQRVTLKTASNLKGFYVVFPL
jgi:hypothetical protein